MPISSLILVGALFVVGLVLFNVFVFFSGHAMQHVGS